jgi:hypothetical protein
MEPCNERGSLSHSSNIDRKRLWGYNESQAESADKEKDLIALIVVYQAENIYFDLSFNDGEKLKTYGTTKYPCSSLSIGITHTVGEYEKTGYIQNYLNMDTPISLNNTFFKIRQSHATFHIPSSILSSKLSSLIDCVCILLFENINFLLSSLPMNLSLSQIAPSIHSIPLPLPHPLSLSLSFQSSLER